MFTNDSKKNNAGREPVDPVFMLKRLFFRGVGMVRATFYIGFTNLVYNMYRLVQMKRCYSDWIIN